MFAVNDGCLSDIVGSRWEMEDRTSRFYSPPSSIAEFSYVDFLFSVGVFML